MNHSTYVGRHSSCRAAAISVIVRGFVTSCGWWSSRISGSISVRFGHLTSCSTNTRHSGWTYLIRMDGRRYLWIHGRPLLRSGHHFVAIVSAFMRCVHRWNRWSVCLCRSLRLRRRLAERLSRSSLLRQCDPCWHERLMVLPHQL